MTRKFTERVLLSLPMITALAISAWAADSKQDKASIVILGCRVDDITVGEPNVHDWRDLQWHVANGELECKREVIALQDDAALNSGTGPDNPALKPMDPDFSNWAACANAALSYTPKWQEAHRGWAVIAVGCPVPIINATDGRIIGYKLPECPSHIPGTNDPISCKYDDSVI